MFHKILVPLDGSTLAEGVIPHAVALAKAGDVQVNLISVIVAANYLSQTQAVDALDWQFRKSEAEAYLQGWATRLKELGINVTTNILEGLSAERIVQFADQNRVDLIILSSQGRSGLSEWNISTVVQEVILQAVCSTMIVRASPMVGEDIQELSYKKILLPVDGSQRSEIVLPAVAFIQQVHQSKTLLTHIIHQPEMPRRTPLPQEDIKLAEMILERNRAEAEPYLKELALKVGGDTETRLLVSDRVLTTLHELVDQENIDLVILSAHGYSGESRFPYGNVVISFLAYGKTPLLIIQDMPKHSKRAQQEDLKHYSEERTWQTNNES